MAFERWNRRFEGPFFIPDFLKHEPGVYVIWCNNKDVWMIVDVGGASDVRTVVSNQKNMDCWKSYCEGKIYYSATYTAEKQHEERSKIERLIRTTSLISRGNHYREAINAGPLPKYEPIKTEAESEHETLLSDAERSSDLSDTENILFAKQNIVDYLSTQANRTIDDFQWSQSQDDFMTVNHHLTIFSGEKIYTFVFSTEELIDNFRTSTWQERLTDKMKKLFQEESGP